MRKASSFRDESIALDVDGVSNAQRYSSDTQRRPYSYSSAATSPPAELRKRSQQLKKLLDIPIADKRKEKYSRGTKRRYGHGHSFAQVWCPAWGRFSIKDVLGILLGLTGAILLTLCLTGASSNSVRNIYFAKIYDKDGSPGEAIF